MLPKITSNFILGFFMRFFGDTEIEKITFYSIEVMERAINEKRFPDTPKLVKEFRSRISTFGNATLYWKGMTHWLEKGFEEWQEEQERMRKAAELNRSFPFH